MTAIDWITFSTPSPVKTTTAAGPARSGPNLPPLIPSGKPQLTVFFEFLVEQQLCLRTAQTNHLHHILLAFAIKLDLVVAELLRVLFHFHRDFFGHFAA